MKLLNCALSEVKDRLKNKNIIFFGAGSWIYSIDDTELMDLQEQFLYIIDNKPKSAVKLGGKILEVCEPDKIRSEKNVAVILTSPVYMYDMFCQLEAMALDDTIVCYAFPFMQMVSRNELDTELLREVISDQEEDPVIPRMIHSFWFSGEEKPEAYRRCVDSWKQVLPDYEIREWNASNYDWHKHPFMERAIELKAWAFAADYARLDVLNEYGGIYLDMDVEVFKSFNSLLHNRAILSFSNHVMIDLAVLGAGQGNPLIQDMMRLYDFLEIPEKREGFSAFFQPIFVREILRRHGIKMNGALQKTENATVFSNIFFMPLDCILFKPYMRNEYNYCVHYDNFGWSFSSENKKEKKMKGNNLLWSRIEQNSDLWGGEGRAKR